METGKRPGFHRSDQRLLTRGAVRRSVTGSFAISMNAPISLPPGRSRRQTVANPRGVELGRKPVRIDAGALGPDLPNRPLTLTADHALLFGDMLVNAGTLAEDGTPIRFVPLAEMPTRFTWWHVELENHEVVLANGGVPAESFIDYVGRSGFDNYDEYLEIAGADRLIKEMPFARISAHRLVPPDLREALGIAPPSYMLPRRKAA